MSYRPFYEFLPEVAERETRVITVLRRALGVGLPPARYSLVELFCDERGCDCRRVFLHVVSSLRPGPEAVIAWGWEPREYYVRWMGEADPLVIDTLKGPALNLGSPRTELAQPLLKIVTQVLATDTAYAARIQAHYRLFRDHVDRKRGRPRWFDVAEPRAAPRGPRRRR